MIRSLAVACLTALAIAAAPAAAVAAVAPGRVAFSVATKIPESNVDASGAGPAVALPDGGAAMVAYTRQAGVTIAQVRADGSLDPSFGSGGIARIAIPGPFAPLQLLRRPDGRLLVVGTTTSSSRYSLPRFAIAGLTATGALDRAFASSGIAVLDLQASCASCAPAALAPDGGLVITGNTGEFSLQTFANPNAPTTLRWIVERLTPAGTVDPAFGSVAASPVGGASTGGYATVVRPSGAIVVLGYRDRTEQLVGLTAGGSPDPAFNGASPATVPVAALDMLLRPSGAIDLAGRERLVRFSVAGLLDAGFGDGGSVAFSGFNASYGAPTLLPAPDGGTTLYGQVMFDPTPAGRPRLHLQRITPSGALGASGDLEPAFGGGIAGARLAQNGYRGSLVARADGSYLAVGGLSVVRYTGEGEGFSTGFVAIAAYTALFTPDTTFGGPQHAPTASVRLPRQRARSDADLRRVLAQLTTSGPGLVRLRVRDGRGRLLANTVEPAFAVGTTTVRIPLTKSGRTILRGSRGVRVRVSCDLRDVLTARSAATTASRLR